MKHLALVFHAPLQSWGGANSPRANSDTPRTTRSYPTKAAVIGLLRSALGTPRGEDEGLRLEDITLASREDKRGRIFIDYQVAQREHHGFNAGQNVVTPKAIIEDGTFVCLVGHEDDSVIERLVEALENPAFSTFLGRRAYAPALPVLAGTLETTDPVACLAELPVLNRRAPKTVVIHSDVYEGRPAVAEVQDVMNGTHVNERSYRSRPYHLVEVTCPPRAEGDTLPQMYQNFTEAIK